VLKNAALLVELGRHTALAGDNYFRARAYRRAANTLSAMVQPLDKVIAENRLRELPGIGETSYRIADGLLSEFQQRLFEDVARFQDYRIQCYCAVNPPSTMRPAPVMNAASSDARKTIPFAMSVGVPSRPIG